MRAIADFPVPGRPPSQMMQLLLSLSTHSWIITRTSTHVPGKRSESFCLWHALNVALEAKGRRLRGPSSYGAHLSLFLAGLRLLHTIMIYDMRSSTVRYIHALVVVAASRWWSAPGSCCLRLFIAMTGWKRRLCQNAPPNMSVAQGTICVSERGFNIVCQCLAMLPFAYVSFGATRISRVRTVWRCASVPSESVNKAISILER